MAGSYDSYDRLSPQDRLIVATRSRKNVLTHPSNRKKGIKDLAGQRGAFTRGPGENIEIAREGKSMGEAWDRVTDERVHIRDKGFHHPSAEEYVSSVLDKNKNKTFVDRIRNHWRYPTLRDKVSGKTMTHQMSTSVDDAGRERMYPNITYDGGKLTQRAGREAARHAMRTGQYIDFDTPEASLWFSQNYKRGSTIGE